MIDPANITYTPINHPQDAIFHMDIIPDYEQQAYDLTNEKDFNKYMKDLEGAVRRSFEYRNMITYLRNNMDMNKCAFINVEKNKDNHISIEIHHHPFTLYDICLIVYNKREYYNESVELFMVAKEVMQRHYELLVGLIPLSKTVHKLFHSGHIFIPVDAVMGNWKRFMDIYKDFMTDEQYDVVQRIIEYSEKYNAERNMEVIKPNTIYLDTTDERYQLPDFRPVYNSMIRRIDTLKANQYKIPEVTQIPNLPIRKTPLQHDPIVIEKKEPKPATICAMIPVNGDTINPFVPCSRGDRNPFIKLTERNVEK